MNRLLRTTATSGCLVVVLACQPSIETPEILAPEAFHGRWLLINYWALWCSPCREEIPELNRLAEQHADTLTVLGVNYDTPPAAELKQAATQMGISFRTSLEDPARTFGFQRPKVLPTTYLFGPEGKLRYELQGPQTYDSLLALIEGAEAGTGIE